MLSTRSTRTSLPPRLLSEGRSPIWKRERLCLRPTRLIAGVPAAQSTGSRADDSRWEKTFAPAGPGSGSPEVLDYHDGGSEREVGGGRVSPSRAGLHFGFWGEPGGLSPPRLLEGLSVMCHYDRFTAGHLEVNENVRKQE